MIPYAKKVGAPLSLATHAPRLRAFEAPRFALRLDGKRPPKYKPCVRPMAVLRARVKKARLAVLMAAFKAAHQSRIVTGGAPLVLASRKSSPQHGRIRRPGHERMRRPRLSPRIAQTWQHHIGVSAPTTQFGPNEPAGMTVYVNDGMGTLYNDWNAKAALVASTRGDGNANRAKWNIGDHLPEHSGTWGGLNKEWTAGTTNDGVTWPAVYPKTAYVSWWQYMSSNLQFKGCNGFKTGIWWGFEQSGLPNAFLMQSRSGNSVPNDQVPVVLAQQWPPGIGHGTSVNWPTPSDTKFYPLGTWVQWEALIEMMVPRIRLWANNDLYVDTNNGNESNGELLDLGAGYGVPCTRGFWGVRMDPYWGGQNNSGVNDTWLVNGFIDYDRAYVSGKDLAA